MLSWDPTEPTGLIKASSFQRQGSKRSSGGGSVFSGLSSASLSRSSNEHYGSYGGSISSSPLQHSMSGRRSAEGNPYIKEGLKFMGWSSHVDTRDLNTGVQELDTSLHKGRLASQDSLKRGMERDSMDGKPGIPGVAYRVLAMPEPHNRAGAAKDEAAARPATHGSVEEDWAAFPKA